MQQGNKFDEEKVRVDLLSVDSLMGLAGVLTHGAGKYGDRNWEKGINFNRVYGAALRHLMAWWNREDIDKDSGLPHIDHAAACIHFLQHYTRNNRDYDNRPGKENPSS